MLHLSLHKEAWLSAALSCVGREPSQPASREPQEVMPLQWSSFPVLFTQIFRLSSVPHLGHRGLMASTLLSASLMLSTHAHTHSDGVEGTVMLPGKTEKPEQLHSHHRHPTGRSAVW